MGFQNEADKVILKEQMMFKQTILEVEGLLGAVMACERNLQTLVTMQSIPKSLWDKKTTLEASLLFVRVHPHLVRFAEGIHKIEASMAEKIMEVVRKNPILKDHILTLVSLIVDHLEIIKKYATVTLEMKISDRDLYVWDAKEHILDTYATDLFAQPWQNPTSGRLTQPVCTWLLQRYREFHKRLAAIHTLLHVENYDWVQHRQNLANSYLERNRNNYAVTLKLAFDRVLKPWKVKVLVLPDDEGKKEREQTALFIHSLQNMEIINKSIEANKSIEQNSSYFERVPKIPVVVAKITFEVLLEGSPATKKNCGVTASFNSSWNKFEFQFRGASFASPDGLGKEPEEAVKELMKALERRISEVDIETWMNDNFNNGNVLQFRAA